MPSRTILLLLLAFALLAAGCRSTGFSFVAEAAEKAPVETKSPASDRSGCPVTTPPDPAFVPPDPYPAKPPDAGRFWYGENGLWTALPEDGSWGQLAMGEKFWWWSEDFDVKQDTTPELHVTAQRLDGTAAVFEVSEATNGYHPSFHWAMLAGVQLPSPGCWEFTGKYNEQQLVFVVWIPGE